MGEIKMENEAPMENSCPHCVRREEEASQNEEISMAFLLALMPVITLTFFGQVGLL